MRPSPRIPPSLVQALMLAVLAGLFAIRETVSGTIAKVLVDLGHAADQSLARHELLVQSREQSDSREKLRHAEAQRDALAGRLAELEARHAAARARAEELQKLVDRIESLRDRLPPGDDRAQLEQEAIGRRQSLLDSIQEITQLEGTHGMLADQLADAERRIETARDRLLVRESELARRQAAHEARELQGEILSLDNGRHE